MTSSVMMMTAALVTSQAPAQALPNDLSVMSYNVHGLPWPITSGRARALHSIGERLAQMREAGNQPHLVLLQEAFSPDAKAIAREAGYPFVASGPRRGDHSGMTSGATQRQFAASDNRLKGEGDGKIEDSGLLILSDYPILDVERVPYARFACAGFDCLANKGILMARVLVPGSSQPITIIDTHMNSRAASGVAIARANAAYGWQVEQLRTFVSSNVPTTIPAIVAGDLNVGNDHYRRAMIAGGNGVLSRSSDALGTALATCKDFADRAAVQAIVTHGKDWMFTRNGSSTKLVLRGVAVPFGREANGKSLSDHFGYITHYVVADASKPGALKSAMVASADR